MEKQVWQGPNCDGDCIKTSPKLQLLWGVPGLQWSVSISIVQGRNSGEPATGSWVAKAHWCMWGVKAGPCGPIQQTTVLKLKLLKEVMLVLVERCQDTQYTAVCCVWGCIAADQSGCPCWPLSTDKHMAPGCTMGRRQGGMLWATFCWETLGLFIHVDVTLRHNTYKYCLRPCTPFRGNGIPQWPWPFSAV